MEENLKSIKVDLDYFDENGIRSIKSTTIGVNTLKLTEKPSYFNNNKHIYELSFSLVLPDHIHKFVLGKSVPSGTMVDSNRILTFSEEYPKTLTSNSIKSLCESYWNVLECYKWLKDIDKQELEKVIFFTIETNSSLYNSEYNSVKFGKKNQIKYKFSIGWVSSKKDQRFNIDRVSLNKSNEYEFYKMKFVKWTKEREEFFENTQSSFENIINNLDIFEKSLNEETINAIIENKTLLLTQ